MTHWSAAIASLSDCWLHVTQSFISEGIASIAPIYCKLNYPTFLPSSHTTSNLTRNWNYSKKKSSTSAQGLIALGSTLLGLSTIAIGLRFYARHVQKAPRKLDDWVTLPCLLLFIGTTATTFYGVNKKVMGYPTPKDLREVADTAEMTSKLYIAFDFFSITTLGGVKISALLFFRRIFCVLNRQTIFSILTRITITIVVLWTVTFLILTGLQCGTHFSALWSGALVQAQYCHISYPFLLGLTVSDFILDVWIICLPLPQIWKIQASLRRKLGVMGIFLLALVGLAACIARLVVFVQIEHAGRSVKHDSRLINTKAIYWSVLETGLCLIAVNLPSLYFLSSKVKPESVLRRARSMVSLRSDGSAASSPGKGGTQSHLSSLDKIRSNSSSSPSHITNPHGHSVQAYAMHDISHREHVPPMPLWNIQVTDRISQCAEDV